MKTTVEKKKKKETLATTVTTIFFDVITLNNFVFDSMNYFQTMWFAMGTICTPNIF